MGCKPHPLHIWDRFNFHLVWWAKIFPFRSVSSKGWEVSSHHSALGSHTKTATKKRSGSYSPAPTLWWPPKEQGRATPTLPILVYDTGHSTSRVGALCNGRSVSWRQWTGFQKPGLPNMLFGAVLRPLYGDGAPPWSRAARQGWFDTFVVSVELSRALCVPVVIRKRWVASLLPRSWLPH